MIVPLWQKLSSKNERRYTRNSKYKQGWWRMASWAPSLQWSPGALQVVPWSRFGFQSMVALPAAFRLWTSRWLWCPWKMLLGSRCFPHVCQSVKKRCVLLVLGFPRFPNQVPKKSHHHFPNITMMIHHYEIIIIIFQINHNKPWSTFSHVTV